MFKTRFIRLLRNSKKQQWTITNYVILVYAAIFGLSRLLKNPDLTQDERWVFGLLIVGAGVYATWLLKQIEKDLGRYRGQLDKIHTDTIRKEDLERYEIGSRPNPGFLIALIGVVVIGGVLVIYSLLRDPFMKLLASCLVALR
jgi:hypothetical protein